MVVQLNSIHFLSSKKIILEFLLMFTVGVNLNCGRGQKQRYVWVVIQGQKK